MNIRGQISQMRIIPDQKHLTLAAREVMKRYNRTDLFIPVGDMHKYPQIEDLTLVYVYRAMKLLCGVSVGDS